MNLTLNGDSRVVSATLGDGDDTITVNDTSRIFLLKMGQGTNTLTTAGGNLESIYSFSGVNTLNIGAGGAQQIVLSGDAGLQTVSSTGFIGSLQVYDAQASFTLTGSDALSVVMISAYDNSATLVNSGVSYLRFGDGGDDATLSNSYVGLLHLDDGDDTVTMTNGSTVEALFGRSGIDIIDVGDGFVGSARLGGGSDDYFGGGDEDFVRGGAGDDLIRGEGGDDQLFGGDDNDILVGGADSDVMAGGIGADTFIYEGGDGDDVITDFEVGVDLVDLSALGIGFGDLTFAEADGVATVSFGATEIAFLGLSQLEIEASANFTFA